MELSHEDHIFKSSPLKLAKFLQINEATADSWHESEYRAILEHQLNVPLCSLLLPIDSPIALREALTKGASLQALVICKEWAKAISHLASPTIPLSISIVLYYAAICAAKVQHQMLITTASPASLRLGVEWCLSREWLSQDLRTMFTKAAQVIKAVHDANQ
jgi:hypothetical protein